MSEENLNEVIEVPVTETPAPEAIKVESVEVESVEVESVESESVEAAKTESPAPEAVEIETAKAQPAAGALDSVMEMKENNPKVFYGIIAGAAGLVLMLAMLGGDEKVLPSATPKNLAAGQKYTLQSPNATAEDGEQTIIRLVTTPGAITAFDDDDNKTEECRKFPEGTHVTVLDQQKTSSIVYAKVQIDEEACNGTIGWVLAVNL
jgi:GW (Gly-Tryp) dipeptide domain